MEDTLVDGVANQWVKVWLDNHQYKVIDTSSTSTVGEMRKAMTAKTGAESAEILLEISLSNGDKSIRKMDEEEHIQQVLDKHKTYTTRVMWITPVKSAPTSADAKPEAKYRCPPSKWSQVFKSVDNSIQLMKENYQNLPSEWLSLFKSLDTILLSTSQPVLTQSEIKFLISKCAAILLSLPSKQPEPTSPYFTGKGRPKSLEIFSSANGLEASFRKFEQELTTLKDNLQSRTLLTPTETLLQQQTEIETDDEDTPGRAKTKQGTGGEGKREGGGEGKREEGGEGKREEGGEEANPLIKSKSRLQEKVNLTLDLSPPTPAPSLPSPFSPITPRTPSLFSTPRTPQALPSSPLATSSTPSSAPSSGPSSGSPSFISASLALSRVPNLTKGRSNSISTPCTPIIKFKQLNTGERTSGPDTEAILKVLYQALSDHRQFIEEEDEDN